MCTILTMQPAPPPRQQESPSPAPTRRIVRPTGARRAEVVAAALSILAERGAAALTARAVAARSGLALGQISYHFRDMDDLLAETYAEASRQLATATERALSRAGASARDRLAAFLHAGFGPDLLTERYMRLRVELWAATLTHPDLAARERALYDRYRADLTRLLADAAAEAGRPPDDLPRTANAIMATLDGLWLDWLRRRDDRAVQDGLATCLALAGGA